MDVTLLVVLVALLAVIVLQQVFFMRQIQKLVDKAMSRSFQEYRQADKPFEKVKIPVDPAEDLRALQEFQM